MNGPLILTAMLPEHLLLVGMLAILGLEIRNGRQSDGFALALLSVAAAAAAASTRCLAAAWQASSSLNASRR